jgi:tetratricopeptide (TPR) repeat protein
VVFLCPRISSPANRRTPALSSSEKILFMNTNLNRAFFLVLFAICLQANFMSAQINVEDNLRKADRQFDLYVYNTALNSYNEVLRLDPNNAHALARKADCFVQLNRPAEALTYYSQAVNRPNVAPDTYFRFGKALMLTGDYVGAKRWFTLFADSNPSLGQHYSAMCDFAQNQVQLGNNGFNVKNERLNTTSADFAPVFYGNRILFNSCRTDIKRKAVKGEVASGTNEVFVSQRNPEDGLLQVPGLFIGDLQKSPSFNEGPVAYSGNGSRVAFCYNKLVDGTRQIAEKGIEMNLFTAEVNADGKWATAKPFPYNSSDYAIGFPFLNEDGNQIYFASNMPGGMGGWDLYMAEFQTATGLWGVPRNLGPTVNTAGNELTPFLTGNTLYFASDWHLGLGGMDIFKASYQGGYATDIINMGAGVNSSRDDYGFVFDPKNNLGYLTSNRADGRGNEDIWQVSKAQDQFTVTVQDSYKQPVADAEIDFTACGAGVMRTNSAGRYTFAVNKGTVNCAATVRKAGYPSSTVVFSTNGPRDQVITLGSSTVSTVPATYNTEPTSTSSTIIGAPNEALGSVVDAQTKDPVFGVEVIASPWPNGVTSTTYTNYSGQYILQLEPGRAHTLTFRKVGYQETVLNFVSGASAAQTTIVQTNLNTLKQSVEATKSRGGATPVTSAPAPATYSTSGAAGNNTPVQEVVISQPYNETVSGYSIQLNASPDEITDARKKKFESLEEYGNLYVKTENKTNKLRLGVFSTKKDAEIILKKAKALSKDAFVVEDKNAPAYLAVGGATATSTEASYTSKSGESTPVSAPQVTTPPIRFAVQIASHSANQPLVLNRYADLAGMGNLYTRPEADMMRIRVGVWPSQLDAEAAQAQIMARGYKDAFVVVEKSGTDIAVALPPTVAAAAAEVSATPTLTPTPTPNSSTPNFAPKNIQSSPTPSPAAPSTDGSTLPDLLGPITHSTGGGTMAPISSVANPSDNYMVRICSLTGDASKFDVKKAEKAGGTVDARQSPTGAIIMLLTNVGDLEGAKAACAKLIAAGFKDAYVVHELNSDGVLRRVLAQ